MDPGRVQSWLHVRTTDEALFSHKCERLSYEYCSHSCVHGISHIATVLSRDPVATMQGCFVLLNAIKVAAPL